MRTKKRKAATTVGVSEFGGFDRRQGDVIWLAYPQADQTLFLYVIEKNGFNAREIAAIHLKVTDHLSVLVREMRPDEVVADGRPLVRRDRTGSLVATIIAWPSEGAIRAKMHVADLLGLNGSAVA